MMKICVYFSFISFLFSAEIRATTSSLTSGINSERKIQQNEENDQVSLFETPADYPVNFGTAGTFYQNSNFGPDLKRSIQQHSNGRRQTGIIYGDGKPIGILQPYQESFRFMPIKDDRLYAVDGGRSSIEQQQEPYINLMYPLTRFARNIDDNAVKMAELEASNAEFLDKHYPSMLVDFKIHNKLHPMASKSMQNFKRSTADLKKRENAEEQSQKTKRESGVATPQKREINDQTSQPQKREDQNSNPTNTKKKRESTSLSDAEFDALKASVAKRESTGEKAGITDALNGLWSDMGLIEDDLKDNNEKLVQNRHGITEDEDLEDGFDNQKEKIEAPAELKRDSQINPAGSSGGTIVIPNKEAEDTSKITQPEKKRYIDVSFITKEEDKTAPAAISSETLVIPNKREAEQKEEIIEQTSKETKRAIEVSTTETYEQYEKRVAREIKNKIKELKEEVKRELGVIDEDKDEEDEDDAVGEAQRKKRNIANTLMDEESHFIDPNQNLEDVQLHPHIRRRRRTLSLDLEDTPSENEIISTNLEDLKKIDSIDDGVSKDNAKRNAPVGDFNEVTNRKIQSIAPQADTKRKHHNILSDSTYGGRESLDDGKIQELLDFLKDSKEDEVGSLASSDAPEKIKMKSLLGESTGYLIKDTKSTIDPTLSFEEAGKMMLESLDALSHFRDAAEEKLRSISSSCGSGDESKLKTMTVEGSNDLEHVSKEEMKSLEDLESPKDFLGEKTASMESLGNFAGTQKTKNFMDYSGNFDPFKDVQEGTGEALHSLGSFEDSKNGLKRDVGDFDDSKDISKRDSRATASLGNFKSFTDVSKTDSKALDPLGDFQGTKDVVKRNTRAAVSPGEFDGFKDVLFEETRPLDHLAKSKDALNTNTRTLNPLGDNFDSSKDVLQRKTRSIESFADYDTRKRKTLAMDSMGNFDDSSMKDMSFDPLAEDNQEAYGRANQFLANIEKETRMRKANNYNNARFNLDDLANTNYRWQMARNGPDYRKRSSRKFAPMNAKRESGEGTDYESDNSNGNDEQDEIAADVARKQEESRKVSINNKANEQFKGGEHKKASGFNKNFYYYYGAQNGASAPSTNMGMDNEAGKRENPPAPSQRMAPSFNYRSATYPGQFYKSSTSRLHNARQSFMKGLQDEDLNTAMTFKRMARRLKRHSGKNYLIPSRNTANAIVTNLSSRNVTVPRYMWWRNYTVPFAKMAARQNFTEADKGKNNSGVQEWRTKKQQNDFGTLKSLDLEGKKKIGLIGTFRNKWYEENLPKSYLQNELDVYKTLENRGIQDNYTVIYNNTYNNNGRKMLFWFPDGQNQQNENLRQMLSETSTSKNLVDFYEYQEYEDYVQTTSQQTVKPSSITTEKTTIPPTTTTKKPQTTQTLPTKEPIKSQNLFVPNANLPVWLTRGKRDVQEDMVREKRSNWFWPSFFQDNDQPTSSLEEEDEAANFENKDDNVGAQSAFSLTDDGEIETDLDEFDLENGGAFDREKRQADFTPFYRSRRYADVAGFEPKQILTEISEDELFGSLPQGYAGELSRYKRVKRWNDMKKEKERKLD